MKRCEGCEAREAQCMICKKWFTECGNEWFPQDESSESYWSSVNLYTCDKESWQHISCEDCLVKLMDGSYICDYVVNGLRTSAHEICGHKVKLL